LIFSHGQKQILTANPVCFITGDSSFPSSYAVSPHTKGVGKLLCVIPGALARLSSALSW
jgi:hypothetical protein